MRNVLLIVISIATGWLIFLFQEIFKVVRVPILDDPLLHIVHFIQVYAYHNRVLLNSPDLLRIKVGVL